MRYSPLGTDEVRQYVLDPYILRYARIAWYVTGRDHRTEHVPLFNLSRVHAVGPTADTFDYESAGGLFVTLCKLKTYAFHLKALQRPFIWLPKRLSLHPICRPTWHNLSPHGSAGDGRATRRDIGLGPNSPLPQNSLDYSTILSIMIRS